MSRLPLTLPLSDRVPFVQFAAVAGIRDDDEGVLVADIASLHSAVLLSARHDCHCHCHCHCQISFRL